MPSLLLVEDGTLMPTADLVDRYRSDIRVIDAPFRQFGAVSAFCGPAVTIRCPFGHFSAKEMLATRKPGAVAVIDGGGRVDAALLGDGMAQTAIENGWRGIIVFGAVRDALALRDLAIGIKALATNPWTRLENVEAEFQVPVVIGREVVRPGDWLYSDEDGIVISKANLDGPGLGAATSES